MKIIDAMTRHGSARHPNPKRGHYVAEGARCPRKGSLDACLFNRVQAMPGISFRALLDWGAGWTSKAGMPPTAEHVGQTIRALEDRGLIRRGPYRAKANPTPDPKRRSVKAQLADYQPLPSGTARSQTGCRVAVRRTGATEGYAYMLAENPDRIYWGTGEPSAVSVRAWAREAPYTSPLFIMRGRVWRVVAPSRRVPA